jgi:hypothetical protein
MPLHISNDAPTLFIKRAAFERANLTRRQIDERLNLAADEFRVERDLVTIGPITAVDEVPTILEELEGLGLTYFDDFFELSGNWPNWLRLYASSDGGS